MISEVESTRGNRPSPEGARNDALGSAAMAPERSCHRKYFRSAATLRATVRLAKRLVVRCATYRRSNSRSTAAASVTPLRSAQSPKSRTSAQYAATVCGDAAVSDAAKSSMRQDTIDSVFVSAHDSGDPAGSNQPSDCASHPDISRRASDIATSISGRAVRSATMPTVDALTAQTR